jgi:hypothetical protein
MQIVIYFAHTRKKDLTILAFALIMAQEAHRFETPLSHWRPRAKIFEKSSIEFENFGGCSTWNILGTYSIFSRVEFNISKREIMPSRLSL